MRRAAKRDKNHREIADAFRQVGCSVFETDRVGEGFPDLILGVMGRNVLVEVKSPETRYGRAGLNPNQTLFNEAWRGDKVVIVTTADEAFALVQNVRRGVR